MSTNTPKRLHVVNVRLDDETLAILRAEAEEQHRPLANLLAAILKDYAADKRCTNAGKANDDA